MESATLQPLYQHIKLTDYFPLPRGVLELNLPSTALLIYSVLLDRATLSQKNGYADELGKVYVIYPIENLAQTLHISDTAVKRHLRTLEECGLIHRVHQAKNQPSHIYLRVPKPCIFVPPEGQICTTTGAKMPRVTGRKVPTNNKRNQQEKNNSYYQHGEEESL